ncbi:MAG: hypothetical protein WBF66_11190 [Dehalococcoidia bacterium]
MEHEGRRGRGEGRGHRGHGEEQPLIIELAQVLLDLYRVWESLVRLAKRVGWREEEPDEDRSDL